MKADSIGFDLDGTLWNSLKPIMQAWHIVAEEYGAPLSSMEELRAVMGLNKTDLMNKLFPAMSDEDKSSFFDKASLMCNEIIRKTGGVLFDGLEETLSALGEKHKLFIVSNCPEGYIEAFLAYHGLGDKFCDFECAGKTGKSKGENIKAVIERNGFKNAVYVGDTQGDADAAELAEVPFIFASYGFGEVKKYDKKIERFTELIDLLK